jgi:hypothetical protein
LRDNVRRGDEIDVVRPILLQPVHYECELVGGDFGRIFSFVAYVPVLAELAGQIALGKENRSRPAGSDKGSLFAEMQIIAGDPGQAPGAAEADFAFSAIDAAFPRANGAVFEHFYRDLDSAAKLSASV